ncbi:polysaccharide deacetylase family protein [Plantactinospora veratri]|uniref:Polysaccharide deacetylase family protein n=1 Tax=Plantactinospora veratri TaxID=1436122 RepID=A0ABU7SMT9_9ACTN
MPTMSRTRMLTIATLVAVTVLGGAYALGHTLGRPGGPLAARPESRAQHQADGPTDQHSADRAGGPAEGRADPGQPGGPADPALPAPPATVPPSGGPQPADPDRTRGHEPPRLPPEQDGPQGARISTGASYVALTFDDGPDPRYTPQILAALAEYHVKATFCLVGENAQAHPELVRAIVAEGHTLCNHSWRHDVKLGSRPSASIRADLVRTNEAIRAAVPDARIGYFRQPGGAWTASVVAVARQLEMTSLHWAVDPQDWTRPGAGAIAARVSAGVGPGAIVLLHDAGGNRQGTLVALHWLLPDLARKYALAALPSGPPPAGTPPAGTPSAGQPAAGQPSAGTPPQGRPGGAAAPAGQPAAGTPAAGQPVWS